MNQLLTIWKHVHSQMPWLRLRAEPLKTNASSVRSDRSTASSSNVATGFKRKLSSYVEYCQQILMYQISKEQILMYQISKEFLAKCDTIHRSGLCGDCAERLWASGPAGRRCPLCRSGFAGVMRIADIIGDGEMVCSYFPSARPFKFLCGDCQLFLRDGFGSDGMRLEFFMNMISMFAGRPD
jgi:hypothetical protein